MTNTGIAARWIPTTDTFGARLALVRNAMGWNMKEAADECGINQTSWGNWEQGVEPRGLAKAITKIVMRTGVDRDWLLWGAPPDSESRPRESNSGPSHYNRQTSPFASLNTSIKLAA